jgi:hypothetical protein
VSGETVRGETAPVVSVRCVGNYLGKYLPYLTTNTSLNWGIVRAIPQSPVQKNDQANIMDTLPTEKTPKNPYNTIPT